MVNTKLRKNILNMVKSAMSGEKNTRNNNKIWRFFSSPFVEFFNIEYVFPHWASRPYVKKVHFAVIFIFFHFCSFLLVVVAIMGRIVERDSRFAKDSPYQTSAKYNIQIQAVFKKSQESASTTVRKTVPLIVSAKDLECRCPKLKPNRYVNKRCFAVYPISSYVWWWHCHQVQ